MRTAGGVVIPTSDAAVGLGDEQLATRSTSFSRTAASKRPLAQVSESDDVGSGDASASGDGGGGDDARRRARGGSADGESLAPTATAVRRASPRPGERNLNSALGARREVPVVLLLRAVREGCGEGGGGGDVGWSWRAPKQTNFVQEFHGTPADGGMPAEHGGEQP